MSVCLPVIKLSFSNRYSSYTVFARFSRNLAYMIYVPICKSLFTTLMVAQQQ